MHIVNFPSRCTPILCKHTCIVTMQVHFRFWVLECKEPPDASPLHSRTQNPKLTCISIVNQGKKGRRTTWMCEGHCGLLDVCGSLLDVRGVLHGSLLNVLSGDHGPLDVSSSLLDVCRGLHCLLDVWVVLLDVRRSFQSLLDVRGSLHSSLLDVRGGLHGLLDIGSSLHSQLDSRGNLLDICCGLHGHLQHL